MPKYVFLKACFDLNIYSWPRPSNNFQHLTYCCGKHLVSSNSQVYDILVDESHRSRSMIVLREHLLPNRLIKRTIFQHLKYCWGKHLVSSNFLVYDNLVIESLRFRSMIVLPEHSLCGNSCVARETNRLIGFRNFSGHICTAQRIQNNVD